MKRIKHIGVYGLIVKDNKIVLIKKNGGPYDGKLDLPGGTIEFGERPEDTLKRELKEEVGIDNISFELFNTDSVLIEWEHKGELEEIHHIGIFYLINSYINEINNEIKIDLINDDSKGADFYNIDLLKENELSSIANIAIKSYIKYNK